MTNNFSHKLRRHLLPIAILTLATLLLPLPTIHYGYLLEDYMYLRQYSPAEVAHTFYTHWEPTMIETKGIRPMHSLQYGLFHFLIGGDPVRNHLLALGLHLLGAYLIYLFVFRCTGKTGTAFWTAFIYPCLATTAWQVSWLVNRQHLLLVIFLLGTLICYDRFLHDRKRTSWGGSFIFFLLALLLKEAAVTFPLMIGALALIVRRKSVRSQVKPLLPFFLLLLGFITYRSIILSPLPDTFIHPPPPPRTPTRMISEYSHGLVANLLQSHGVRDPKNRDFPVYGTGVSDRRDLLALLSVAGILIAGGILLFRGGETKQKRFFLFGLAVLLLANILVAAWYRTNRLFISSLGVAMMIGTLLSISFDTLTARGRKLTGVLAVFFFLVYLSVNLSAYLEIQRALRPDGYLALTWDRWVIKESYLPWMEDEQLLILKDKLIRSGRWRWAQALSAIREDEAQRLTRKPFEPVRRGKPGERIQPSRRFDNLWYATPVPGAKAEK